MQSPQGFDPREVFPPPLPDRPSPIASIALDLSGRCNLACRYCAESATQPTRPAMTAEMLEQVLTWFCAERSECSRSVHIGSGEPLLALPLLRRIDLWARTERGNPGDRVPVFLSTNGTLLDRTTTEWLATAGWEIKISIDGPKAIHDRWRVTRNGGGTFDRVESAARVLAQCLAGRLTLVAVLCRGADPCASYDLAASIGASHIEFVPVATHDREIRPGSADLARYREFIFEYARRRADVNRSLPQVCRFERYVLRTMGYHNRRVPCAAGRTYVGVGPDGALYPCMRFVGIERYRIGQLPEGVDPDATLAFQRGPGRTFDQRDSCRACWAAPLCGGPCFACAELFDIEHLCEVYRADAAAAVWLVQQLRERAPERLVSFLPL